MRNSGFADKLWGASQRRNTANDWPGLSGGIEEENCSGSKEDASAGDSSKSAEMKIFCHSEMEIFWKGMRSAGSAASEQQFTLSFA